MGDVTHPVVVTPCPVQFLNSDIIVSYDEYLPNFERRHQLAPLTLQGMGGGLHPTPAVFRDNRRSLGVPQIAYE